MRKSCCALLALWLMSTAVPGAPTENEPRKRLLVQGHIHKASGLGVKGNITLAVDNAPSARGARPAEERMANPMLETAGNCIRLANNRIGIEFVERREVYRLAKLYGISFEQDYLTSGFAGDPQNLWQIVFRRKRGRDKDERIVGIADADKCLQRSVSDDNSTTLILQWRGMDLPGMKNAVATTVSITLNRNDHLSRWRIRVDNRSTEWGIWQVHFPVLRLRPVGDGNNAFVLCKDRGRLVENCFDAPSGWGHGFDANEDAPIGPGQSMPGSLSAQFQAIYNMKTGKGLYLATQDSEGHAKHLRVVNNGRDLLYLIAHDPKDMGYPKRPFATAYDFVAGPFQGDWYDACQIYRSWALQQPWCSKGPLLTRNDIPRWFKEAPLFLVSHSYGDESLLQKNLQVWREYLDLAGCPLPGTWYGWKHYDTETTAYDLPECPWRVPEMRKTPVSNIHDGNYPKSPALSGFGEMCRQLKAAGGYAAPYVCLQILDQGRLRPAPYAEAARPAVSRDIHGQMRNYPGEPSWCMCVHSEWWRRRLVETASALMEKEHVGGLYLDTMQGGGQPCFATTHGHTCGGGRDRCQGMHELARRCREAVKVHDPMAFTDGESPTEDMIDVVDGILYQYTLRPDISVPLFATVYGDYIPRYGMRCSPPEGAMFFLQAASLFVEGAKLGRIDTGGETFVHRPSDPKLAKQMAFLKRLIRFYRQERSRQYLSYGQLLRPMRFTRPDPVPFVQQVDGSARAYQDGRIVLPVLLSGVFRIATDRLGIFIVNVGEASVEYAFDTPLTRYFPSESVDTAIEIIDESGQRVGEARASTGRIAFKGNVAGHDAAFLELRVQATHP